MFNEVLKIVSGFGVMSNRKITVVCQYLTGLAVKMKKHNFEAIGKMAETHPSRFSYLLNDPETVDIARSLFNRALRKRLARVKIRKGKSFILIDATFTSRSSKHVENSQYYHSGSGSVRGHKWLNIVLVHEGQVIPLASLPLYTKSYCAEHGIEYRSEPDMVVGWMNSLRGQKLFAQGDLKDLYFLADSGYDVKKIQKAIRRLGSHFVIALKSSRTVKGIRVSNYFKRHKKGHRESTIRFIGSGQKRITFKVRLATGVHLKGVSKVNVACSKGTRGSKVTMKYIATSDINLTARDIIRFYRARWKIETWHKEVKQDFGFRDCSCSRFSAVHAHVLFVLTAYLIQSMLGTRQISIDEYQSNKLLRKIRAKLTKIGQVGSTQTMVREALQRVAA